MADGDDVPYFFREIMAMITTITEEEWGSSKDPMNKKHRKGFYFMKSFPMLFIFK